MQIDVWWMPVLVVSTWIFGQIPTVFVAVHEVRILYISINRLVIMVIGSIEKQQHQIVCQGTAGLLTWLQVTKSDIFRHDKSICILLWCWTILVHSRLVLISPSFLMSPSTPKGLCHPQVLFSRAVLLCPPAVRCGNSEPTAVSCRTLQNHVDALVWKYCD